MTKSFQAHIAVFAVLVSLSPPVVAASPEAEQRHIQAAVLLDGIAAPIIGGARCRIADNCQLIPDVASGVTVTVHWHRQGAVEPAELTICCRKDCSFTSGRSTVSFQSERVFDLFDGAENRIELKPVVKPGARIGQVSIIVE